MASKSIRDAAWNRRRKNRAEALAWRDWKNIQGGFNSKIFEDAPEQLLKRAKKLGIGPTTETGFDFKGGGMNYNPRGTWKSGKSGSDKWSKIAWEMGIGGVRDVATFDKLVTKAELLGLDNGNFLTDGEISGDDIMKFRSGEGGDHRRSDEEFQIAVNNAVEARYKDQSKPMQVEGSQNYQSPFQGWIDAMMGSMGGGGNSPYTPRGSKGWAPTGGW